MIKAKELRIGNFLYRQTLPVIPANFINKKIISVGKVDEDLFNNKIDCQFAPIPLTEEWLLKFGFEIVKGAHQSWRTIKINDEKSFDIQFIDGEVFYSDTRLKYVHKLQNLYFALTGQELQLTNSN